MPSPNDIKKGTVFNLDGELWIVNDFQRVSPGKGSSFVRKRMKNIRSGKVVENNFKSAETLAFEDVQSKRMQYIFNDGNLYTFMDNTTYEQVSVSKADIGDDINYLKEGLEVTLIMHNGVALAVEMPKKIQYKVSQTEPAVKGDTASGNVSKDAVLDNGLTIRVPIFIREGDEVLVNTDTGEYSERVAQ